MHPRKSYNPNRGKKHAARMAGRSGYFPPSPVKVTWRAPEHGK